VDELSPRRIMTPRLAMRKAIDWELQETPSLIPFVAASALSCFPRSSTTRRRASKARAGARLVEALADDGHIVVTDPWPAARRIERSLRDDARLEVIDEQVHRDPGRTYYRLT
jgi:hypothetical protein